MADKKPPKARKRKKKPLVAGKSALPTANEQKNRATFRGFLRYIQRPGVSVRQIWEDERIGDSETSPYIRDVISWSAFQRTSVNAKWRLRREEHWREVKRKVMDHAQTEAVQAEIQEIGALESVRGLVLDRIVGNADAGIMPAIPKSLEGAVGAFVQLDKRISQKRDLVIDQTASAAAGKGGARAQVGGKNALTMITVDDNPLTDEEVAHMSRALAESRARLSSSSDGEASPIELPSILAQEDATDVIEANETSPTEDEGSPE